MDDGDMLEEWKEEREEGNNKREKRPMPIPASRGCRQDRKVGHLGLGRGGACTQTKGPFFDLFSSTSAHPGTVPSWHSTLALHRQVVWDHPQALAGQRYRARTCRGGRFAYPPAAKPPLAWQRLPAGTLRYLHDTSVPKGHGHSSSTSLHRMGPSLPTRKAQTVSSRHTHLTCIGSLPGHELPVTLMAISPLRSPQEASELPNTLVYRRRGEQAQQHDSNIND